jgi:outer membrane protein assembly factor BamB
MVMNKNSCLLATTFFLFLILFWSVSVVLGSSIMEDLASFNQDQNNGNYVDNSSANSAKLLWNYTTGRMVQSSPAVAYGYVFVGSRDSAVYCLNASSGQLVWKYPIRSEVWSSPVIYNMFVYIGADNGYVYCLDIGTGKPVWRTQIGGEVRSSPTFKDGIVYISSANSNVFALNGTDGNIIWSFPASTQINSSPTVSNGLVYVTSNYDFVYAINASTGSQIWSHPIRTSASSTPTVYSGYVYIGSYDGFIYGLNASTGFQIWKYQTEDEVASSPTVAYGRVYVGSEDSNVYCLNASTGSKIWQSPTGYWVTSSPTVVGGNVYVGSQDYDIYCFNATTGGKKWSYPTGNIIESSPAIWNNNLYIGSDDSNIYALALNNSTSKDQLLQTTNSIPWTTIAFDTIAFFLAVTIILSIIQYFNSTRQKKQKVESNNNSGQNYSWLKAHTDLIFLIVILGLSSIFFVNLGSGVLQVADEQTYSQWAFHMLKTGDYLTPWAFGTEAFIISKPPLLMWLMSLAYQVLGVNDFASRIWTATFGMFSLIFVFYLGKKLYNRYVGFLSAIVLGTSLTFFVFSRYAMTDVPLVCFSVASIYFFVSSEGKENAKLYSVLSGVFLGLALMTKQIAALLIPLIIIAYLIVTKRSPRFLFTKNFSLFWTIGLLVFSPWLIYMSISFGTKFWQSYFLYSFLIRTSNSIEGHVEGYLFYFWYLVNNENWLWIALLPFAAGLCAFNTVIKRLKEDTLIFLWMAIVFIVFTFAQTKIYWYILPAFPAFSIAISNLVYQLSKKIRRFHRHPNV